MSSVVEEDASCIVVDCDKWSHRCRYCDTHRADGLAVCVQCHLAYPVLKQLKCTERYCRGMVTVSGFCWHWVVREG